MIVAGNFRVEDRHQGIEVSCALRGEGFPDRLTFHAPHATAHTVDVAQPNWAAMALIWPAMLMGQDLVIEADLSPLLLYNMQNDLMALMRNYEPRLKPIRITAGLSGDIQPKAGRDVMTGFSGGVDSFSTFALYTRPQVPPSLQMTALAVFQVGALGPTARSEELLPPAVAHARAHADDHGLKTYSLSSNMDEVFAPAKPFGPVDFRTTVGFRNAAAALLMQNGVGTYLPSGTVAYNRATFGPYSCTEPLDPALQPLFSTEKLRVQPAGAGLSRIDKIALIADDPQAQRRLNVCISPPGRPRPTTTLNCSACWKCIQTLLVLEAMGKLEGFAPVFDLGFYRANRRRLLQSLSDLAFGQNYLTAQEQILYARAHGLEVPRARGKAERRLRKLARAVLRRGQGKPYAPAHAGAITPPGRRASPDATSAPEGS
ncbi:hypothetical protein [Fuscibacter oryzae]|uniref:Uncharacterized protein n=1 Tax=Fuscibacter oryzae TaxID=2803939 RepID=A0A8J7MUU6_9RHOB|nr:hypothetical protein [Fuscibacter oryzae]MBL4930097.1 hypothetical protein [Fuscibacter oryzae]